MFGLNLANMGEQLDAFKAQSERVVQAIESIQRDNKVILEQQAEILALLKPQPQVEGE